MHQNSPSKVKKRYKDFLRETDTEGIYHQPTCPQEMLKEFLEGEGKW